jgi:hypothetical protein
VGLIRPHTSLNIADTITSFSRNSIGYDWSFGVNGYFAKSVSIRGDIRQAGQYGKRELENGDVEPSSASRFPPIPLNGRGTGWTNLCSHLCMFAQTAKEAVCTSE